MKKRRLFEVSFQFGRPWHTKRVWAQSRLGAANKVFREFYRAGYVHKTRQSHLVFYPAKYSPQGKWVRAFLRDKDYDLYL